MRAPGNSEDAYEVAVDAERGGDRVESALTQRKAEERGEDMNRELIAGPARGYVKSWQRKIESTRGIGDRHARAIARGAA